VDSFVAFDFETLNDNPTSICEIAFVKFDEFREDGNYPAIHSLIKPREDLRFSIMAFNVHGIEPGDLVDAPLLSDIWSQIEEFLGDLPLVAHGATNDLNKLLKTLAEGGISPRQRNYYCSLVTARNKPDVLSDLPFSVENLAAMAGAEWFKVERPSGRFGHHALIDAAATGHFMLSYLQSYEGSFEKMLDALSLRPGIYSHLGVIQGNTKKKDSKAYFGRYVDYSETTFEERRNLLLDNGYAVNANHIFSGQNFVLTLDLDALTMKEFWDAVALTGGNFKSTVTKKVHFLVEGPNDSQGRYIPGESPKSVKAAELNESGKASIQVLSEERFIDLVGADVIQAVRDISERKI
jgi:DNA polymerase III epsilon subunit-like protein